MARIVVPPEWGLHGDAGSGTDEEVSTSSSEEDPILPVHADHVVRVGGEVKVPASRTRKVNPTIAN